MIFAERRAFGTGMNYSVLSVFDKNMWKYLENATVMKYSLSKAPKEREMRNKPQRRKQRRTAAEFRLLQSLYDRAQLSNTNDVGSKRIVKTSLDIAYTLIFLLKKMWVAFAFAKATHIFSAKIPVNLISYLLE